MVGVDGAEFGELTEDEVNDLLESRTDAAWWDEDEEYEWQC